MAVSYFGGLRYFCVAHVTPDFHRYRRIEGPGRVGDSWILKFYMTSGRVLVWGPSIFWYGPRYPGVPLVRRIRGSWEGGTFLEFEFCLCRVVKRKFCVGVLVKNLPSIFLYCIGRKKPGMKFLVLLVGVVYSISQFLYHTGDKRGSFSFFDCSLFSYPFIYPWNVA